MDEKNNDTAFAILVMSNKDVYYLTRDDYIMLGSDSGEWFNFRDARSKKRVRVRFAQMSSVVELH